jgi:hypothetical protein
LFNQPFSHQTKNQPSDTSKSVRGAEISPLNQRPRL